MVFNDYSNNNKVFFFSYSWFCRITAYICIHMYIIFVYHHIIIHTKEKSLNFSFGNVDSDDYICSRLAMIRPSGVFSILIVVDFSCLNDSLDWLILNCFSFAKNGQHFKWFVYFFKSPFHATFKVNFFMFSQNLKDLRNLISIYILLHTIYIDINLYM